MPRFLFALLLVGTVLTVGSLIGFLVSPLPVPTLAFTGGLGLFLLFIHNFIRTMRG